MAITIIATNNTGSSINLDDLGVSLSSSEVRNLTNTFDSVELVESIDLNINVASGDIGINDGIIDLSISDALAHINIESEYQDLEQDSDIGGVISTDLVVVDLYRSTQYQMTSSWEDVIFDVLELENDNTVLEWDTSNTSRVLVKESGLYEISCGFFPRANSPNFINSYYRVRKNDNTVIGHEANLNTYAAEIQQFAGLKPVELSGGEFLTLQTRTDSGDDIDILTSCFYVKKLEGVKGDDGAPGGTTITVQDNDTTITTNTDTINFEGDSVSVVDEGNNKSTVIINDSSHVFKYVNIYDSDGNVDINVDTPTAYPFNEQTIRDVDAFDHSTLVNNTRLSVSNSGWYKLSYQLNYDGGSARRNIRGAARVNGTTYIEQSIASSYTRNNTDDYGTTSCQNLLIHLNSSDYIELMFNREGSSGTTTSFANQCWLQLEFCRGD